MFEIFQEIIVKHQVVKLNSMISIFPSGDYRMIMDVWSDGHDPFIRVTTIATLISTKKDTFG